MRTRLSLTSAILLALSGTVFAAETGAEANVGVVGAGALAVVSTDIDADVGLESSAAEADASFTTGTSVEKPRTARCLSTNAVQTACLCGHER
jgi:hypothetical protein